MQAKSERLLSKDESFGHTVVNILTFCTATTLYCAASKKFPAHNFLLSNLYMTWIFSKELVVNDGGICPGGGSHFSPTKNNYEGLSIQNVYPTMMINDVLKMPISNTVWRWNQWLNWCVARNILMISVLIKCFKGYIFSFQYRRDILH